jgi:hypothetical protein
LQVTDPAKIRKKWKMSGEHQGDRTSLVKLEEGGAFFETWTTQIIF